MPDELPARTHKPHLMLKVHILIYVLLAARPGLIKFRFRENNRGSVLQEVRRKCDAASISEGERFQPALAPRVLDCSGILHP